MYGLYHVCVTQENKPFITYDTTGASIQNAFN